MPPLTGEGIQKEKGTENWINYLLNTYSKMLKLKL